MLLFLSDLSSVNNAEILNFQYNFNTLQVSVHYQRNSMLPDTVEAVSVVFRDT